MASRSQRSGRYGASDLQVVRCIVGLIVATMALVVTQLSYMPSALACDPVPLFQLSAAYLSADDFGQADSQLAQDFDAFWETDTGVVVRGGYVIETVHTLEPEGEWTRGSVSTVVQTWGQPPADRGPFLHRTVDLATTTQNSCGEPGNGPELGTRRFVLVTDLEQDLWRVTYSYANIEAAETALTAAFGQPETIDRDTQAEELMAARLGNTRSGSGSGIAFAFGLILVIGGVLAYQYRKKKLFWQWEQIQAELDSEQGD